MKPCANSYNTCQDRFVQLKIYTERKKASKQPNVEHVCI